MGYVEALSPEGDIVVNSEFVREGLQLFTHDAVAYDPELQVGDFSHGESDSFDHGWKIFDLSQTAYKEEREAALLRMVFRRGGFEPVDAVVNAGDAIAPGKRGIAEVVTGGVADGYDPIAGERDEVVDDLGFGVEGRSDQAMASGDNSRDTGESSCHGSLKGRCRIVAVDNVRPEVAEHTKKTHGSPGHRARAIDVDVEALRAKHFEQRAGVG